MTVTEEQAPADAQASSQLKNLNLGVLLVGAGLSIISHTVLHDLGQVPALRGIPSLAWLALGAPVGMLAAHWLAADRKRTHGLLVLPLFVLLTLGGNLLSLNS